MATCLRCRSLKLSEVVCPTCGCRDNAPPPPERVVREHVDLPLPQPHVLGPETAKKATP